jgi:hypothetical protein
MPAWMQVVTKSVLVSQVWWAQISSAAAVSLVRPAAWQVSVPARVRGVIGRSPR